MTSSRSLALSLAFLLAFSLGATAADKPTAQEIIAKHLAAIGAPEARSAPQGREWDGISSYHLLVGGSGGLQGTSQLVSREQDLHVHLAFNNTDYPGEDFSKVGDHKPIVGQIRAGARSQLGNLLEYYPEPLREGLFGGVLSTAWPFYDPQVRGAKLTVRGTRTIDKQKLYEVEYEPAHSSGNVHIYVYFDPQSFQHVATRYVTLTGTGGFSLNNSGGSAQNITLEERFSEFRTVNGLNLPLRWTMRLVRSESTMSEYEIIYQKAKWAVEDQALAPKPLLH